MENSYPWHSRPLQQLMSYKQQNRMPHALLFIGIPGLGKKQFALTFAHTLLCKNADTVACGQCHACHLIQANSHPDLLVVEPAEAGQMIKVDQIREVVQFVSETAQQGGQRVIIINPANAMNINAANALLKTLEEPAPNTTLILINDQNLRLPATIISRCQKINFQKPSEDVALNWMQKEISFPANENTADLMRLVLNLSQGAPLRAKEIVESDLLPLRKSLYQGLNALTQNQADPLQLATELQDKDTLMLMNLLFSWLQDLMRFKISNGQAELINIDHQAFFARVAQAISYDKIVNYLDHVKKIYSHLLSSLNLNRQLVLEELFIRWGRNATAR